MNCLEAQGLLCGDPSHPQGCQFIIPRIISNYLSNYLSLLLSNNKEHTPEKSPFPPNPLYGFFLPMASAGRLFKEGGALSFRVRGFLRRSVFLALQRNFRLGSEAKKKKNTEKKSEVLGAKVHLAQQRMHLTVLSKTLQGERWFKAFGTTKSTKAFASTLR